MTDRLFLPMLTEASRMLTENIVRDPADVDMGLILGIGFPAPRGGLLRWADNLGLPKVLEKLQHYEKLGPRFQPTEQIRQLAAAGKGLFPQLKTNKTRIAVSRDEETSSTLVLVTRNRKRDFLPEYTP